MGYVFNPFTGTLDVAGSTAVSGFEKFSPASGSKILATTAINDDVALQSHDGSVLTSGMSVSGPIDFSVPSGFIWDNIVPVAPLSGASGVISIPQATTGNDGYASSGDIERLTQVYNTAITGVIDSNSLDLTALNHSISGNVKISTTPASGTEFKLNTGIDATGIIVQSPVASTGATGVINSTDYTRFDSIAVCGVSGDTSALDNQLVRWDGNNANKAQYSTATLDDAGNLSTTGGMTASGLVIPSLTGNTSSSTEVRTYIEAIDDSQFQEQNTGFLQWTSGADASTYQVAASGFTILRSGIGYIKGKRVAWAANQSTVALTANNTHYVYIDINGLIGSTTTYTTALYSDNILLYQIFYDGTNILTNKENHPYNFPSRVSSYLHNNVGVVIRNGGANISRVTTGTGAATGDRALKLSGADVLEDHGLETTIPDSAGAAITWDFFYTNALGNWIKYATQEQMPMVYNNAGTITALGTGPTNDTSIIRLYVSKDDINSATPKYIAVINNALFNTVAQAQTAITNGTVAAATNELAKMELAQLGYAIIENNGTGGIINTVVIQKSSFSSKLIGSGPIASHLALSDLNGGQYVDGGHTNLVVGNKLSNSAPNAANDTTTQKELNLWLNETTDKTYVCVDNSAGAAIWKQIAYSSSGDILEGSASRALTTVGVINSALALSATLVKSATIELDIRVVANTDLYEYVKISAVYNSSLGAYMFSIERTGDYTGIVLDFNASNQLTSALPNPPAGFNVMNFVFRSRGLV